MLAFFKIEVFSGCVRQLGITHRSYSSSSESGDAAKSSYGNFSILFKMIKVLLSMYTTSVTGLKKSR